ncbi:SH3 domain-containing protein C23A1.17-like [Triticum dicoccoides]|uniref:SH3 domain-containing protein C23A1.17-like n=1 Tax=Triticum dicoccoides TaxID=85692 RepID=UPI00188F4343|nr:SH3 domain-containing protein C23A1.17-like [Triticum dicoccoides]
MPRTRALCCLMPSKPSGDARRRSSAACICCIGAHHRPSGGSGLAPVDADNSSVRTPLTSCCGTGDAVRTPRTPKTPSARRLCGVRSRTPRRAQQVRRFTPAPAPAPAEPAVLARAAAPAAPARTPVAAAASAGAALAVPPVKTPVSAAASAGAPLVAPPPPARTPVAAAPSAGAALVAPPPARTPVAAAASAGAALAPPPARTPGTPSTPIGRTQRVCCVTTTAPAQAGNAKSKSGTARRRWLSSASKTVAQTRGGVSGAIRDSTTNPRSNGDIAKAVHRAAPLAKAVEPAPANEDESVCSNEEYALLCREGFSREDVAAVTIQAYFRAHLARRAFKALRSLVRLQAVARGAYVRRQAEVAVHCMQAMARLQARVRSRQTLAKPKDNDDKLLLLQN